MAGQTTAGRRLGRVLLYILFTALVYAASLWWVFPYGELALNLESRLRGQGITLRIDGLGPGPFPGLAARKVRLETADNPALGIDLADASLQLPLQRLLRGERSLQVRARALGGEIVASGSLAGRPRVAAEWSAVDLTRVPLPPEVEGLRLQGKTSGTLDATVDLADPYQSDLRLDGRLEAVKVVEGKVRGIPVPGVEFGTGAVRASSQGGKLEIETAEFQGGDVGIDFKGSILLRQDVPRSLINGLLSVQPTPRAAEDLALVFALFPGSRGSDGRYTARVRGSLGEPRLLKR